MKTKNNHSFQIQCPMPEFDFDMVTMGHGSGGTLTHQLLDSGIFDLLDNEFLQKRHDGAFLNLSGPVAFTTDSFVVSPIIFPGGNIGDLAVNGTVNDLAMCGAIPQYLSLGLILEEGLSMQILWEVLVTIKSAALRAGVQVVTGDTKVVEKGKGDQIFINTTGIGLIHPKAQIDPLNIRSGDKIILSGPLAVHGITIMSLREGLTFETTLESDTRALNHTVKKFLDKFEDKIHLMRDPTRGGVATVLSEIANQAKVGMNVNQNSLPILSEVDGACEMLGLDPLYVANEGVFVSFVAEEIANEALNFLNKQPNCENATIIGEVVDKHKGRVVLNSAIGGKRIINMLPGDQLPRIC